MLFQIHPGQSRNALGNPDAGAVLTCAWSQPLAVSWFSRGARSVSPKKASRTTTCEYASLTSAGSAHMSRLLELLCPQGELNFARHCQQTCIERTQSCRSALLQSAQAAEVTQGSHHDQAFCTSSSICFATSQVASVAYPQEALSSMTAHCSVAIT